MVLSRGRPLFLTQIEWDLNLILTSPIKVRKVSSFGRYMYLEYIRVVQIEKERIWNFNAENCPLSVHPWRLSIFDLFWWSSFVLFSSIVFFQFNFAILSYSVMIVTHGHFVEANFRGISRPLQHSSVWLPHFLISNGFSNTIATTFFILQLLTVYNNYYNSYFNNNDELTRQALGASNQCRTVN